MIWIHRGIWYEEIPVALPTLSEQYPLGDLLWRRSKLLASLNHLERPLSNQIGPENHNQSKGIKKTHKIL